MAETKLTAEVEVNVDVKKEEALKALKDISASAGSIEASIKLDTSDALKGLEAIKESAKSVNFYDAAKISEVEDKLRSAKEEATKLGDASKSFFDSWLGTEVTDSMLEASFGGDTGSFTKSEREDIARSNAEFEQSNLLYNEHLKAVEKVNELEEQHKKLLAEQSKLQSTSSKDDTEFDERVKESEKNIESLKEKAEDLIKKFDDAKSKHGLTKGISSLDLRTDSQEKVGNAIETERRIAYYTGGESDELKAVIDLYNEYNKAVQDINEAEKQHANLLNEPSEKLNAEVEAAHKLKEAAASKVESLRQEKSYEEAISKTRESSISKIKEEKAAQDAKIESVKKEEEAKAEQLREENASQEAAFKSLLNRRNEERRIKAEQLRDEKEHLDHIASLRSERSKQEAEQLKEEKIRAAAVNDIRRVANSKLKQDNNLAESSRKNVKALLDEKKAARGFSETLSDLVDRGLSKFFKKSKDLNGESEKLTKNTKENSKALTAMGKLAVDAFEKVLSKTVELGKKVLDLGLTFEESFQKVKTLADNSVVSFDSLSTSLLGLSSQYGVSIADLNNAAYEALSSSVKTADLVEMVNIAQKSAIAGFTDTKTAISGLTSVMNAYGMSVEEADDLANKFLITQNLGKTTFGEIAANIGEIAPNAKIAGISIDDVLAAIATLTAQGLSTSEAITQINGALNSIIDPTKEAEKAADSLGISFNNETLKSMGLIDFLNYVRDAAGENNDALTDLFGNIRGFKALAGLTEQTELYNEALRQMSEDTSTLDEAFTTMTDTVSYQKNVLKEKLKNYSVEMFNYIKTPVKDSLEALNTYVDDLVGAYKEGGIEKAAESFEGLSEVLFNTIDDVFSDFTDTVSKNSKHFASIGGQIILNLVIGLLDAAPSLVTSAFDIIAGLSEALSKNSKNIALSALDIIKALGDGFVENAPIIVDSVLDIVITVADTILDNTDIILDAVTNIIFSISNVLAKEAIDLATSLFKTDRTKYIYDACEDVGKESAERTFSSFLGTLLSLPLGPLFNFGVDAGKETISGVIDGLKSGDIDSIADFGRVAAETFSNAFLDKIESVPILGSYTRFLTESVKSNAEAYSDEIVAEYNADFDNTITGILSSLVELENAYSDVSAIEAKYLNESEESIKKQEDLWNELQKYVNSEGVIKSNKGRVAEIIQELNTVYGIEIEGAGALVFKYEELSKSMDTYFDDLRKKAQDDASLQAYKQINDELEKQRAERELLVKLLDDATEKSLSKYADFLASGSEDDEAAAFMYAENSKMYQEQLKATDIFIEQLEGKIKYYNEEVFNSVEETSKNSAEIITSEIDSITNHIKGAKDDALKSSEEYISDIEDLMDSELSSFEKTLDAEQDAREDALDAQLDALEDYYDKAMDSEEERHDAIIDNLKKEKEEKLGQFDEEEYQRELQKEKDALKELQHERALYGDYSTLLTSADRKAASKLDEDIQNQKDKIAEKEYEHQRDLDKQALTDKYDAEIEAENKLYEANKEALNKEKEDAVNAKKEEIAAAKDAIKEEMDYRKNEFKEAQKSMLEEVKTFSTESLVELTTNWDKYVNHMSGTFNGNLSSMSSDLKDYFLSLDETAQATLSNLTEYYNSLDETMQSAFTKLTQGLLDSRDNLQEYEDILEDIQDIKGMSPERAAAKASALDLTVQEAVALSGSNLDLKQLASGVETSISYGTYNDNSVGNNSNNSTTINNYYNDTKVSTSTYAGLIK